MTWTILSASNDFGVSRETLRKRLTIANIKPKTKYSTKEICAAIYGDMPSEKLRLTREQADKVALENAEARRELINAGEMKDAINKCFSALIATVQAASNLEHEDREKLVANLQQTVGVTARMCGHAEAPAEPESKPMERDVSISEPRV